MESVGFGGSCHWCTEAIFQSLRGVSVVNKGWIASDGAATAFSEAVLVDFDPDIISLETLIAVHLYSHSCTSRHSLRSKYRSAVYTLTADQALAALAAIEDLQTDFDRPIITQVLHFKEFRLNEDNYLNYYYSNPDKPFCRNIVHPKLSALRKQFGALMKDAGTKFSS